MTSKIKSYSELKYLSTLEERFKYLALHGSIGRNTFGYDRYINQRFYRSSEWRRIRNYIIVRDAGCDLGIKGYEIHERIYIHHMNPMTPQQISEGHFNLLEPEYLITTTHKTHNAIHYGNEVLLPKAVLTRKPGDTKLW